MDHPVTKSVVKGTQGLVSEDQLLDGGNLRLKRLDHVVGYKTAGRHVVLDTFVGLFHVLDQHCCGSALAVPGDLAVHRVCTIDFPRLEILQTQRFFLRDFFSISRGACFPRSDPHVLSTPAHSIANLSTYAFAS